MPASVVIANQLGQVHTQEIRAGRQKLTFENPLPRVFGDKPSGISTFLEDVSSNRRSIPADHKTRDERTNRLQLIRNHEHWMSAFSRRR